MSREVRKRAGGPGLRPLEALESRDLLALVLAPLSFTTNQPFTGQVASFGAADLPTATGYTATVDWGDGTPSTAAGVAATSTGFDVLASKTYHTVGSVVVSVKVVPTNVSAAGLTSAGVVNVNPPGPTPPGPTPPEPTPPPPLALLGPLGLTATAGLPFTGTVAVVSAGSSDAVPADFTSLIDWGDGTPSTPGLITGSTGSTLVLVGSHTYARPGTFPVTAKLTRTASGQTAQAQVSLSAFGFEGGLDPLSGGVVRGGVVVTDQQQPLISGQAEPKSTVSLWFRRTLAGDPVYLGQTQADDSGRWGLVIGPIAGLPILLYGTSQSVNGPPTPTTLLNEGRALYVTPRPVTVHRVAHGPVANELRLTVPRPGPGGYDPAGLLRSSSYQVVDGGGRAVSPIAVRTTARGPSRSRPVTLVFAPGTLPQGSSTLQVSYAGPAGSDAPGLFRVKGRRG